MDKAFIHPLAVCETNAVGAGTRVWAYCHLLPGAVVGRHCNLGEGVFVEGGARIGDRCTLKNGVAVWEGVELEADVFVGPNAAFTNDIRPRAFLRNWRPRFRPTLVKRGASLGANTTILCGLTIGEFAMIGAGCVVTRDVPPHTLVVGNPGRILGRVCFCGTRLDNEACPRCGLPLEKNSLEISATI